MQKLIVIFNQHSLPVEIAMAVILILVIWLLLAANHKAFRRAQRERRWIHLVFFEKIASFIIVIGGIVLALSLFEGVDTVWKAVLGGTAIFSAVFAITAQDVVDDILSGMMISIYKPFEIGNRIELENGIAGIVKDITMRHVVIHTPFNEVIIPNGEINDMTIKNYSYHMESRSIQAVFHVAYGTDVEKAMHVIRAAVIESPYSIPGYETENGPDYAPVFFMAYEDSSLRLETRVYFAPDTPSEDVISHINLSVNKALAENNIEIPYPYINIVKH